MSFLAAPRNGTRRVSGQSSKNRKSSVTSSSLAAEFNGDNDDGASSTGSGMHSLAHELAAALMPEPSAGSKLLQEEFGIEYDEGAEGIDEQPEMNGHAGGESLADEIGGAYDGPVPNEHASELGDEPPVDDIAVHFGSSASTSPSKPQAKQQPQQDPMDVLAKDLESTDKFLSQLRHLDADSTHSSSSQPSIEKFASDIIRHINDSVRDRESQVRELLEYEREFRKIAGEVNGNDVLGKLDALKEVDGLSDKPGPVDGVRTNGVVMETIQEDTRAHQRASSNDWEMNPDDHFLEDEGDETFDEDVDTPSPMKDSFVVPPPMTGPPTVPKIIPELVHVRTLTTSLATSLTAISEHAQMNGAANADAGRKIRALKNKLGGWRSEWDSAEQSRLKIERWEAGLDGDDSNKFSTSDSNTNHHMPNGKHRRLDARRITDEHLRAFELALADAGMKTQAIMAKS